MLRGYAIRDKASKRFLKTRARVDGVPCPVTVWAFDCEDILTFRKLRDAKRMLKLVRSESRQPERLVLLNRRWKVVDA